VRLGVFSLSLLFAPTLILAQAVRGVVVDPADRPVAGVVVILVNDKSAETARALSNERGEFRVSTSTPGTYKLRTLRIGFRPVLSDPITLAAGEEVTQRLALKGIPFNLDTVHAQGKNTCKLVARDSALATWAVWEQVRAALAATQLTASARSIQTTTVVYDRTLDVNRGRITEQTAGTRSEIVRQPWRSIPPDSLRKVGYVVQDQSGILSYYAPGLDVLLSQGFLEDHCVKLVAPVPGRIGVAFEPNSDRKKTPEIKGIIWLDRKSSELRGMEYRYVNSTKEDEQHGGGEMQFVRMSNGSWVVWRWNIRMPMMIERRADGGTAVDRYVQGQYTNKEQVVAGLKVQGGELVLVTSGSTRGRDTLWSHPPQLFSGRILDSASGTPIGNARVELAGTNLQAQTDGRGRFSIAGVMPGNYSLHVRTPSLDSVNAVNESPLLFTDSSATLDVRVPTGAQITSMLCGRGTGSASGILLGTVLVRGDTAPQANVDVLAEWTEIAIRGGTTQNDRRTAGGKTDARGDFHLCNVPINTPIKLSAKGPAASSEPVTVRIPPSMRFGRTSLSMIPVLTTATFVGSVVSDSTRHPIANADVSIPDLSLSAQTNEKGEFRIAGVAPGKHQVVVKKIGFGALDASIDFVANEAINRTVVLGKVVSLDSVRVTGDAYAPTDLAMKDFEEHRKRGFGSFMARADLAKFEGRSLGNVMTQLQALDVVRGSGGQNWVTSKRGPASGCSGIGASQSGADARAAQAALDECLRKERIFYVPDAGEEGAGVKRNCYAQVFLDRSIMNVGTPTPPFDLNSFDASRIEALEWYPSAQQAPTGLPTQNALCGVLILHTRR